MKRLIIKAWQEQRLVRIAFSRPVGCGYPAFRWIDIKAIHPDGRMVYEDDKRVRSCMTTSINYVEPIIDHFPA